MRWKADLLLLVTAALWGTGFVAQRYAAERMGTFAFNGARFLVAALLVGFIAAVQGRRLFDRRYFPGMALAGILLFAAAGFQQAGLATTSIGNASFITGLYVVLVPLILFRMFGQRIARLSWLAVALAVAGIGLLSLQEGFRLASGDLLELAGALMWALHVIIVGQQAGHGADVLVFSATQFLVCGLANLTAALIVEPGGFAAVIDSTPVVLYSALIPIGLGFTLQIAGQKHAPPVDAAILLSMEAVFATLFGYLFLQEVLSGRQLAGCGLMLAAMILSQVAPVVDQNQKAGLSSRPMG